MGYHTLSCLNQTFQVPEKYKLVKEIGQGAYGLVWYNNKKKNEN